MAKLLISYDLRKPNYTESDYEDLWDELDSLGAKRIQDSVWGLSSNLKAESIFDTIRTHLHPKDRLLVVVFDDWKNVNGISRIASL